MALNGDIYMLRDVFTLLISVFTHCNIQINQHKLIRYIRIIYSPINGSSGNIVNPDNVMTQPSAFPALSDPIKRSTTAV